MKTAMRQLKAPLVLLLFTLFMVRVFVALGHWPWFAPYVPVAVALLLIYVPVLHARRQRETLDYLEGSFADVVRSLQYFIFISVLIFPLFFLLNHYWQLEIFGRHFRFRWPAELFSLALNQFALIALPEEIFFRGYLQPRVERAFAQPWRFAGIAFGPGFLLSCLLFAFAHSLIFFQWWHFAIFFPSLVFGWLRKKTGKVGAGALFHMACNVIAAWIAVSYR